MWAAARCASPWPGEGDQIKFDNQLLFVPALEVRVWLLALKVESALWAVRKSSVKLFSAPPSL